MKISIVLLVAVLLLAGCASPAAQTNSAQRMVKEPIQSTGEPAGTAAVTTASQVSKEQAQDIALAHAGLTDDQVTGLHTEYEIDDGIPRFEVQFRQGRWAYDYEINADTGAILSCDRDD